MGQAGLPERHFVAVASQVQPRVREQIGREGIGQVRLKVADAGTNLDDTPRNASVHEAEDAAVETRVDCLQQRFRFPGAQVALDLRLVLSERRGLGMNLRRRAANITMRNSSHP